MEAGEQERRSDRAPDGADREPNWTTYVQTAATIGAGVLGLAAYVYLLGGAVMWLRLTAARLPADEVMEAFQSRQLLSMGMKALFAELFLLALVAALVWAAWRVACWLDRRRDLRTEGAPGRQRQPLDEYALLVVLRSVVIALTGTALLATAFEYSSEDVASLVAVAVAVSGLLIGVVDVADRRPKGPERLAKVPQHPVMRIGLRALRVLASLGVLYVAVRYMAAPIGLTVLVLVVLLQFSNGVVKLTRVRTTSGLIVPVLILAAALNVIIVSYLSTPPVTFERAVVLTKKEGEITAAYVGRTASSLYLATCHPVTATTSTKARMHVISNPEVERIELGGFRYSFDFGKRPSLWGLFKYYTQAESIQTEDDGFQLDLRKERDVCGEKSPN